MEYPTPRMTLTGILKFDEGIKLEYSDPNWNIWGSKALTHMFMTITDEYMYPSLLTPVWQLSRGV